jgi:tRNA(Ile)-lysidine synthase
MDPLQVVRETIIRENLIARGDTLVVGVSGGPDSLCLLHILCALAPELGATLAVAHLHHGLRGADADADANFVQEVATRWGIPCQIGHADVPALARQRKLAIEETARRARYTFLGEVAASMAAPAVAVAHDADDQVETILMHFLRGAGISGLRGMLYRTLWGDYRLLDQGAEAGGQRSEAGCPASGFRLPASGFRSPTWLIRPLLDVPRVDIEAYCAAHGLTPRFDRSNLDTTFYRNRLRHHLLPTLETYNPGVRQVLRHAATVMADDYAILRGALADAWTQIERAAPADVIAFDRDAWRALPRALQRATLREAVHRLRCSLRDINFVHIEQAMRIAQAGATGERATLPQRLRLRVDYDRIVIASEDAQAPLTVPQLLSAQPLPCPGVTRLADGWEIAARLLAREELPPGWEENADPWQAWLDADAVGRSLIVRPRQPGDRFQPLGMPGQTVKLNEFMINIKLPAALRPAWPLVIGECGIAWVIGHRIAEEARVQPTTRQVAHLVCSANSG